MSGCCGPSAEDQSQRTLLWTVLFLNAAMFVVEFVAGWMARSSGLMADSLDMLADALVYGLSLYAVGRGVSTKARAALLNGSLQMVLGLGVLAHVGWRISQGSTPEAETMGWVAALALAVNASCFALLYSRRSGDINLRSSWICSRNDMIANIGVIAAAGLVVWFESPWPDWIIATLVALIIIHSAWGILRDARASLATGAEVSSSCCAPSVGGSSCSSSSGVEAGSGAQCAPYDACGSAKVEEASCCGSSVAASSNSCCSSSGAEAGSGAQCAPYDACGSAKGDEASSCCGKM